MTANLINILKQKRDKLFNEQEFNRAKLYIVTGDLNFFNSNKYALDLLYATNKASKILVVKFFDDKFNFKNQIPVEYKVINTMILPINRLPLGDTLSLRVNIPLFMALDREIVHFLSNDMHVVHYTFHMIPAISYGSTHVVTIHDLMMFSRTAKGPWLSKANWRWAVKRYRKFPHVVTPTKYVAKGVEGSGLFEGKITVIPHAVSPYFKKLTEDKAGIRVKLGLPTDKRLILSVSSGQPRKNLGVVQEAVERLGPEYKLVRVGPEAGNSITFNKVSQDTLNMIYNACDVLLYPTLEEGFGYPAIEAMATGLPVVTSNIEVMREVCEDAAIFVEPTVDGSVQGVKEALSNSEVLKNKGLKRSEFFSFEKFRKNYINLYSSILPEIKDALGEN